MYVCMYVYIHTWIYIFPGSTPRALCLLWGLTRVVTKSVVGLIIGNSRVESLGAQGRL